MHTALFLWLPKATRKETDVPLNKEPVRFCPLVGRAIAGDINADVLRADADKRG